MSRSYHKGKIYQYSLSGEFIQEHENQKSASIALSIGLDGINSVIKGRAKTSGGFQFTTSKRKIMPDLSKRSISTLANYDHLNKKIQVNFRDEGIVKEPSHREYGRRKIVLNDMQIFCDPRKDIQQVVDKYSKSLKL